MSRMGHRRRFAADTQVCSPPFSLELITIVIHAPCGDDSTQKYWKIARCRSMKRQEKLASRDGPDPTQGTVSLTKTAFSYMQCRALSIDCGNLLWEITQNKWGKMNTSICSISDEIQPGYLVTTPPCFQPTPPLENGYDESRKLSYPVSERCRASIRALSFGNRLISVWGKKSAAT